MIFLFMEIPLLYETLTNSSDESRNYVVLHDDAEIASKDYQLLSP